MKSFLSLLNFKNNPGLIRILSNISWLSLDKVLRLGIGFLVVAWIARYLGPEQYGLWNYAIAFVSIFGTIASFGIDNIVVRDVLKNPGKEVKIIGSAFFLKLLGGGFTFVFSLILAFFLRPHEYFTLLIIGICGAGYIFQAFYVINCYFQSRVKSKYTVLASNSAFLLTSIIKIFLILCKAPLILFVVIGLAEIVLTSAFLICAYSYNKQKMKEWKYDHTISIGLLKDGWPLMLSGIAIMIYMRIDHVMLGQMLDNRSVGIYAVAVRIGEIWNFLSIAISNTLFPIIVQSKEISRDLYYTKLQRLFAIMLWLGIFIAVVMTITGEFIITTLFGTAYSEATMILIIYSWAGINSNIGLAWSQWILNENKQVIAMIGHIFGALLNFILNIFLIKQYGIIGAALATLFSYYVSTFFAFSLYKPKTTFVLLANSFNISKIWKS